MQSNTRRRLPILGLALLGTQALAEVAPLPIAQTPLFLRQPEAPLNLMVMGRDHKLYYEAYNDASDLNNDGLVDVGYKPSTITYYGLFDSFMCYAYSGGVFTPSVRTSNKKCSGAWSGDFLNYVTTSRIDALRKVLYGGKRSTDTLTSTILERGYVPQDGHSWAKEYTSVAVDGFDIAEYTPLAAPTQANTRHLFGSVNLNTDTGTPLMRVLTNSSFRVWNWASIEGPVLGDQCVTSGNNRQNCVTTGGTTYPVVESSYFPTGLQQSFYTRNGTPNNSTAATATSDPGINNHPANAADYELFMARIAIPKRLCGTRTVPNINGSGNPFTANTPDGLTCSSEYYATVMQGTLVNPGPGSMTVYIDGDDAVQLKVNGTVCNGYYGGHGASGGTTYPCVIGVGSHTVEFWHEEVAGGDSWQLRRAFSVPASERTDYTVRVEVCKTGLLEENCRGYPVGSTTVARYKPTGLFHEYGEDDTMMFGLLTGSYRNNQAGGILRKVISSFSNEVDLTTGLFTSVNGIVKTMNAFKINGFVSNSYGGGSGRCPGLQAPIARNQCYDWGNPLAEMMYEGMRYFAGQTDATSDFTTDSGISTNWDTALGLPEVAWSSSIDPYRTRSTGGFSVCAKPFMTLVSDVNPSYDADVLTGVTAIGGDSFSITTLGDTLWTNEFGGEQDVFIGDNGTVADSAPTAKKVSSFRNIKGLSPEEPTKGGSYFSALMAYWGFTNTVNPRSQQKVRTFSVALASPLPRIEFPIGQRKISLVPFGKTVSGTFGADPVFKPTNTIVDFYVEALGNFPGVAQFPGINGGRPFARFRINYEDVEQGNDHDMDAIILYNLELQADGKLRVRLTSEYAAGSANQNLGYIISGTTKDGIYLEVRDVDSAQATSPYRFNTPAGLDAGACTASTPPTDCAAGLTLVSDRLFDVRTTGGDAATTLRDPLWYAAKYGGFNDKSPGPGLPGNGLPDNGGDNSEWDVRGPTGLTPDGNPDNYFLVTNALTLSAQLRDAFQQVLLISRPLGKLSTNSTRINGRTALFQAEYDSRDWTGDVRGFDFNETNLNVGAELWKASDKVPNFATRNVITFNPTLGTRGQGVAFEFANLSTAQKTALHGSSDTIRQQLVDYLRGDRSRERSFGGNFRDRSKLIGDIANSNPAVMSRESYGYERSRSTAEANEYIAFLDSKRARNDYVFVGANDGMLHAFDGSRGTNGGREVFAFIPNGVYANLKDLAVPSYTHKFFVDGSPTLSDVKIGGAWRSVLVGGLGAGGKSVYALDVTNPASFGPSNVLWEFTDPDLGLTLSQPRIARLADGRFAAIFGNGYNSTNNKAFLFVVNIADGTLIRKIDVNAGSAADTNGMGSPVLLDASGVAKPRVNGVRNAYAPTTSSTDQFLFDLRTDTAFAGDLFGNVWKFDLSAQSPAAWSFVKLYQAVDGSNRRQRITAAPQAAAHPLGGVLVFFGTGRYFTTTDNDNEATDAVNSFYAVWDTGLHTLTTGASPLTRSALKERTIGPDLVQGVDTFRTLVAPAFRYGDKFGFYMDFIPGGLTGERVLAQPLVRFGRVFFNSFAPNVNISDDCQPGGRGFLMALDAFTGAPAELVAGGGSCAGCAGISRTAESPPGEPTLLTGDGVLVDVRPLQTDPATGATTGGSKVLGRPYGQLSWRELR